MAIHGPGTRQLPRERLTAIEDPNRRAWRLPSPSWAPGGGHRLMAVLSPQRWAVLV